MSEFTSPEPATPLQRAVWQIERGIQWQRDVNSEGGIQITPQVLKDVLKTACDEAGLKDALKGFKPKTLDDVLYKAQELRDAG